MRSRNHFCREKAASITYSERMSVALVIQHVKRISPTSYYLSSVACLADGRIILGWIFRKWEGVVGTGWSWLRIGTGGGRLWVR